MTPDERVRALSGEWCDCKPTPTWRSLRRSCEKCIADAIRAAVEAETERCAKVAEDESNERCDPTSHHADARATLRACAAAIRRGGTR